MSGKEAHVYSLPSATSSYNPSQFSKLFSVSGWQVQFFYQTIWRRGVKQTALVLLENESV